MLLIIRRVPNKMARVVFSLFSLRELLLLIPMSLLCVRVLFKLVELQMIGEVIVHLGKYQIVIILM